jgi:hypothetical protein
MRRYCSVCSRILSRVIGEDGLSCSNRFCELFGKEVEDDS